MKITSLEEQRELQDFVEKAAESFKKHPANNTFTLGPIEKGELFAVKWGLSNDCILVLKLDDCFDPIIFGQAIKKDPIEEGADDAN